MARLVDKHGQVAVGIMSFYGAIHGITFKLVLRHGFRREAGWILLFIFCISTPTSSSILDSPDSFSLPLVRILGGALQVASATTLPINTSLFIATAVITSAGLSPLLLATLAFVQTVYVIYNALAHRFA
jgi:hypothetical protein